MSQNSARDRERAVQAITRRRMFERRIKRTQRRMAALEGEARQALEDSLAAEQAALAEVPPTLEAAKTVMRQEEGHIRRKTQEALRAKGEWKASYSLHLIHCTLFAASLSGRQRSIKSRPSVWPHVNFGCDGHHCRRRTTLEQIAALETL